MRSRASPSATRARKLRVRPPTLTRPSVAIRAPTSYRYGLARCSAPLRRDGRALAAGSARAEGGQRHAAEHQVIDTARELRPREADTRARGREALELIGLERPARAG